MKYYVSLINKLAETPNKELTAACAFTEEERKKSFPTIPENVFKVIDVELSKPTARVMCAAITWYLEEDKGHSLQIDGITYHVKYNDSQKTFDMIPIDGKSNIAYYSIKIPDMIQDLALQRSLEIFETLFRA